MAAREQFRQALEDLDLGVLRRIWAELMPGLPQVLTEQQALFCAHRARTEVASLTFQKRAYSHRWLVGNGYESGLPDKLRPKAEQMCPVVVEAVLVGVKSTKNPQRALLIQTAMSDAVAEAYADGKTDPDYVRARMKEAREKITRTLG